MFYKLREGGDDGDWAVIGGSGLVSGFMYRVNNGVFPGSRVRD